MISVRRPAQYLGALALAVPLSGLSLLMAAGPALAATGITAPGDGVTFASDTTVRITATADKNTGPAELQLRPPTPGSNAETVNTASTSLTAGASLAYDFDTATCASFPSPCSGRAEAANGVWTVTLVSSGKTVDTRTFALRIPPRAPAGLTARADGYRAVNLTWAKGVEPDLTGWTLYADGGPTQSIGTGACSGTSCATTVTYAQDGSGSHTYSLVAHRSVAPGSSDVVDSPQSSQAAATLQAPPPPPPSPTPAGSGGSSPSGGGSGTGGGGGSTGAPAGGPSSNGSGGGSTAAGSSRGGTTGQHPAAIGTGTSPATVASRRAFALSFQAFAPKLGIPKLPPLPSTAQPAVAPLPDGTYQQTLGYKDVVKTTRVDAPQAAVRRVTSIVGSALDSTQLLRSMAGALVFLLLAAHLRRWLGSHGAD
ncbi:MAG: hypothetical protein NVSMB55_15000 [Mycobacteriales bacterium]